MMISSCACRKAKVPLGSPTGIGQLRARFAETRRQSTIRHTHCHVDAQRRGTMSVPSEFVVLFEINSDRLAPPQSP